MRSEASLVAENASPIILIRHVADRLKLLSFRSHVLEHASVPERVGAAGLAEPAQQCVVVCVKE
jgi:hypothetical protein